ncbi:MAG: serine hydrolase [Candidatus Poribacteria bacterium]|nr:serine hydrolase [Candidatus Poribacteria bacterium]
MKMVIRTIACLVVGVLLAGASVAAEEPKIFADLTSHIDALIKPATKSEVFSGVILVARGDDILYHEAFGYADWELRVPNTPSTRFGVGSLTKALTETIVEILVHENRLSLDAPVAQYIDDFPKGPKGGVPTIRHLYTHRSGVPHRVTDATDETQVIRAGDIVDRVKERGLLFEPGSRRLYSSAGFTCLARVIEIVEDKPYEQILEERIFKPAGMQKATSETGRQLMYLRAKPYHLNPKERMMSYFGLKL